MCFQIVTKDLLENAENLYPNDGNTRKIGARDLLDGLVMSAEPESVQYKERAFLKMKQKVKIVIANKNSQKINFQLINLAGDAVPDFEKKLFANEKAGTSLYPSLFTKPEGL